MACTVLLWAGFLNFFNFMDGIDGISGIESAALGTGAFLIAWLSPHESLPMVGPLTIAAAALGFLVWNWAPARLFMGDVGSIPLGYFLGWFLLFLAVKGYWAPALILPLYYLGDAGITLLKRLVRGEKIWRAHKEHFYQRAVAGMQTKGLTRLYAHRRVSSVIAVGNTGLIGMAVWSLTTPIPALIFSFMLVGMVLWWMETR
jgi:UDP-N-acetylmuramyl pentapeptide phosphotransferase/UDP-N-acetylglucosamine-1-phosphate transferase